MTGKIRAIHDASWTMAREIVQAMPVEDGEREACFAKAYSILHTGLGAFLNDLAHEADRLAPKQSNKASTVDGFETDRG